MLSGCEWGVCVTGWMWWGMCVKGRELGGVCVRGPVFCWWVGGGGERHVCVRRYVCGGVCSRGYVCTRAHVIPPTHQEAV